MGKAGGGLIGVVNILFPYMGYSFCFSGNSKNRAEEALRELVVEKSCVRCGGVAIPW